MLNVPYSKAVMTKMQMCVIAPFAKKISDSDKFDAKADTFICKMGDYCEKFSCDPGVESEVS